MEFGMRCRIVCSRLHYALFGFEFEQVDLPWTFHGPCLKCSKDTHTELSQTNDDSRVTLAFDVLVSTVS